MAKLFVQFTEYRKYRWWVEGEEGNLIREGGTVGIGADKPRGEISKITGCSGTQVDDLIRRAKDSKAGRDFSPVHIEYTPSDTKRQVKSAVSDTTLTLLEVRVSGEHRPNEKYMERLIQTLLPVAEKYRITPCGGADLYFIGRDGFSSRKLALAAALSLSRDWRFRFDIRTVAEIPTGLSPTIPRTVPAVTSAYRKRITPEAIESVCEEKGWACGKKLPHTKCRLCPETESDLADPVEILESGIYCAHCAREGVTVEAKAGYLSWESYVGCFSPRVGAMVRNCTHWTHARLVLKAEAPGLSSDTLRKEAYFAALEICCGLDSPKVQAAETAGENMIRIWTGEWCSADGRTPHAKNVSNMVAELPAVWTSDDNRSPNLARRDLLLQSADIEEYGYAPVFTQPGFAMYATHNRHRDNRIVLAATNPKFRGSDSRFAPKYRPENIRMSLSEAWDIYEEIFPDLNKNYLQLLLAQKGFVEGGIEAHPFILTTGLSESGKGGTVEIAAATCGEGFASPAYHGRVEEVYESMAPVLDRGVNYIVIDELFKNGSRTGKSELEVMDLILNLTPALSVHRYYLGPLPLSRLPALTITDTKVPTEVGSDVQEGRRLVWVKMKKRVKWKDAMTKAGLLAIESLRTLRPEVALAGDAILSDVTDRFFRKPRSWGDVVNELGFKRLDQSTGMEHSKEQLKELFKKVCEAESPKSPPIKGKGWKVIHRSRKDSELTQIWDSLADGMRGNAWMDSRKVDAHDWTGLLDSSETVEVETRGVDNSVYIRFFVGDPSNPDWHSGMPQDASLAT